MKLFKYLHPDRIDVLKNLSIRFSPPIAFNDPFEFKPAISGIVSNEYLMKHLEDNWDSVIESQFSKLPENIKTVLTKQQLKALIQSNLKNDPTLLNKLMGKATQQISQSLSDKSNELIGVLSLTEKSDNLLMWSHYADSHRGYCISFESKHPFFNRKRSEKDEFYYLRKVDYIEYRPAKMLVDMSGTDLFLLKSNIWEYEQEWRICSILTDADTIISSNIPHIHLFKFPPDAVKEIIIGVNASDFLIETIISLVKQNLELNHIKIKCASVSETSYTLKFSNLN
ncbi:DUF2971 domain-containing protein [Photobacterium phosphoreum]|uniref:DUF2971 domain-containing protein n=1 Tax=Photobacterium phosphoreum TaxID=659 RepID=UPI0011B261C4|nr:DUF2971 domain-containing protein [Photobacterium phosphoreum]